MRSRMLSCLPLLHYSPRDMPHLHNMFVILVLCMTCEENGGVWHLPKSYDKLVIVLQNKTSQQEPETTIGAVAIRRVRIHTMLEGITIESIASRTGACRETVSRRLRSTDMRIADYIVLCHAVGIDPASNLNEAIAESGRSQSATTTTPHSKEMAS